MFNKLMSVTLMFFAFGCARVAPAPPGSLDDSWLDDWKTNRETKDSVSRPSARDALPGTAAHSDAFDATGALGNQSVDLRKEADRLIAENRKLATQIAEAKKAGWTGAVVYCWRSGCLPCERLKHDIAARPGWKIGTTDDCHFKIAVIPPDRAVPLIVYFVDGKEVGRIVGYDGSTAQLDAILAKHPKCAPDLTGVHSESPSDAPPADEPYANPLYMSDYYGAFATGWPPPSSVIYATRIPPALRPCRSTFSWGLCGLPLVTHTSERVCDPITGICY